MLVFSSMRYLNLTQTTANMSDSFYRNISFEDVQDTDMQDIDDITHQPEDASKTQQQRRHQSSTCNGPLSNPRISG